MTEYRLPSGCTVKPFALEDAPAVVDLLNRNNRAVMGYDLGPLESLLADWSEPGWEPSENAVMVTAPGGEVIGYAELWDLRQPFVQKYSFARVDPDYMGRGIGTYLLDWCEQLARRNISKAPEGARVSLMQYLFAKDSPSIDLLVARGYRPVRNIFQMEIDMDAEPPAPALPGGVTIRPIRPGEDEERVLLRAIFDAFRDHWGAVDEPFDDYYSRWMHFIDNDPNSDRSLLFLAHDRGVVAGAAFCVPESQEDTGMGWIRELGVLRGHRGRGIGAALLRHSFAEFYRRGKRRVGLRVDANSLTGATKLYEKVGMRVTRQYTYYEKVLREGTDVTLQSL